MTINLEMIKQLLDEFNEKEALTREEINIVEQEIKELEARIESSKSRLEHVSKDREKVAQMMDRYAGNSVFASSTEFKGSEDKISISKADSVTAKASTDSVPVLKGSSDSVPVLKSSSDSIPVTTPAESLSKPSGKASNSQPAQDNSHGKNDVPQPEPPANPFQSIPPVPPARKEAASEPAAAPVITPPASSVFTQPSSAPPDPAPPLPVLSEPQPVEPEPFPSVPQPSPFETPIAPQGGTSPAHLPGFDQSPPQLQETATAVATSEEDAPAAAEEGEDDTVKSINDALRGLFR